MKFPHDILLFFLLWFVSVCLPTRMWEVAISNHSLLQQPVKSLTFSRGRAQRDESLQCPALMWVSAHCAWWAEHARAVEGRSLSSAINVKILPKAPSHINYRELAARNENKVLVICIFAKTT